MFKQLFNNVPGCHATSGCSSGFFFLTRCGKKNDWNKKTDPSLIEPPYQQTMDDNNARAVEVEHAVQQEKPQSAIQELPMEETIDGFYANVPEPQDELTNENIEAFCEEIKEGKNQIITFDKPITHYAKRFGISPKNNAAQDASNKAAYERVAYCRPV